MMYGIVSDMVKTTIYLPTALKRRLERIAGERGTSEAALIRQALDDFVERRPPRPRLPLFEPGTVQPIDDWDEALRGFGED